MQQNTHTHTKHTVVHYKQHVYFVYDARRKRVGLTYSVDGYHTTSLSGPILDKQSGAAMAFDLPALYLKQMSKFCNAKAHLNNLALLGTDSVKYDEGLWSE